MYGEQGFKSVHKTVHFGYIYRQRLLNFSFRVLTLRNLVLQDNRDKYGPPCLKKFRNLGMVPKISQDKYCMVPSYLAAQHQIKLTQFPVCANVGLLFSLEILPQASEKHIH